MKPTNNEFPTLKLGTVVASSDVEKAHLLNDVFINFFNHATPALEVTDLPAIDQNNPLDSLLCTEDEVFEMLSTTVTTKSTVHNDISARMLKETALSMTPAATKLFHLSIYQTW